MGKPTERMIEFAKDLIEKYNYDFKTMTFEECAKLDELKAELGWD